MDQQGNTTRVAKVREALAKTNTTFVPSQVSTTDQLQQLVALANAIGLYDAADCIKSQLLSPKKG